MSSALIIDNWLLQDIGFSLSNGLSNEDSSEVVIDQSDDSHVIRDIPFAGVQIEALLGLLVDIVFRDSLVVDSDFTETWSEYDLIFDPLLRSGLVRGIPFTSHDGDLKVAKQFVLDRLCVTSTLREEQNMNEDSWRERHKPANPYMSAVIWGTAGMLSRSHVFESPYSGHPLRKRVIEQTIFSAKSRDIVGETMQWMNDERLRLFETKSSKGSQKTALLVLPPVALEIIEEAKDVSQLIHVAYQLRDKYTKMREWLKSVQFAIEDENSKDIAKYKKTLKMVSKDLNRAIEGNDLGKVTLNIGFGWPSASFPIATYDDVAKKFGMRALLNNQIFTSQGEKSLRKLLRMFEEENSRIGMSVQDYLRLDRSN